MSISEKIQDLPQWMQNLLAVLLGTCMSVCFPTLDSVTDISLGTGLMINGHIHWGLLILFPVFLSTVFIFINCFKEKKLYILFLFPLVLCQVYPQSVASFNMFRLVTGKTSLEQFRRDTTSVEGGLGSIEPFVESVPQTFIQTGFFVLGNFIKMKMLSLHYTVMYF
eukprot:GFUD01086971.1.p1 GENE.GFUD01086971.1~~GFUD01086971.1.p1  ORF type:complete len:166 (+),score=16.46 GFUD01086971.1:87-584(+)